MALAEYFSHHAEISEFKKEEEFQKLSEEAAVNHYDDKKILRLDLTATAAIMEEIDGLLAKNKKVEQSQLELDIRQEDRWFASLDRVDKEAKEKKSEIFTSDVYGSFTFSVETKDAEGREIKFYRTKKWKEDLDLKEAINSVKIELEELVNKFHKAPVLESGLYRAVLSPDTAYTMFHEGFGAHLSSAKAIDEEGATAFKAKLGQKIFPETLTIIDDPTPEELFGTYKFDEEGQPAKRTVLIENGVLKNYLYDRISAGRRGVPTNGHGRAMFGEIPEPRTANMIIASKKSLPESELIKTMMDDCKRHDEPFGLYLDGRSGEVEYDGGQFRIYASEFYKIYPDGKMEPVSGGFIVGEPHMTLNQLKHIGNNLTECLGYCGAESGTIRTGGLCPSAYFRKIEVHSSAEAAAADSLNNDESEN